MKKHSTGNTQLARIMHVCHPALDAGSKSVDIFLDTALQRYDTRRKNLSTTNHNLQTNSGFTLVELAIVIVIIGLLVGGVMAGQELVNSSKLNSEISTLNSYKSAHEMFKAKYNCMAGDCIDTSIFIDQTTCNSQNSFTSLCRGDRNGKYDIWFDGTIFEQANYWIHLTLTKLIKPCLYASNETSYCSSNFSRFAAHFVDYGPTRRPNAPAYNYIIFTGVVQGLCGTCAVLTPEDAYVIDTKLDDGKPNTGIYLSYQAGSGGGNSPSGNCLNSNEYNFSNSGVSCYSTFKLD